MKIILKRLCAGILTVSAVLTAASCNNGSTSGNDSDGGTNDVNVWTASGIEKILQDTDYSDRYDETTLEICAFRNESEAGQIIITPIDDVAEYTFSLSDLTLTTDSSVKLPKESFEVFNQKYVELTTIKAAVSTGVGNYPDALLPYDKAVEYEENRISAGNNQGLWIIVEPDVEQEPGVYTGNFKLVIDGEERSVPVEVTVFGHVLSEETHVKSWYGVNWNWIGRGELDTTIEMQQAYNEFYLEHRLNPGYLPGTMYNIITNPWLELPAAWLEEAEKAAQDPRRSFYCMPYETQVVTDDLGVTRTTIHLDYLRKILNQIAEYSVEHKVDLFKKAGWYLVFLDEYSGWGKEEDTAYTLDRMHGLTYEVADSLEETLECDDTEFKAQLLQSMRDLIVFIPGNPLTLEPYLEEYPNAKVVPMCTGVEYASAEYRAMLDKYAEENTNGEKWIYAAGAGYPRPCYLTEAPAMSARLLGWQMYDFDVAGDLSWETVFYHVWTRGQGVEYTQDQYSVGERQPGYNGEGQLVYPGREYGIYGPVSTIRFEALSDTHEDYDLLYELEALYQEHGVTADEFDSILEHIVKELYQDIFYLERANSIDVLINNRYIIAAMFNLIEQNDVAIHGFTISSGKATVKLSSSAGTTVSVNGTTLQGTATEGGLLSYSYTFALDQEENYLKVSANTNGVQNEVKIFLSGKATAYGVSEVQPCISLSGAMLETDQSVGCVKIIPTTDAETVSVKLDVATWSVDKSKTSVTASVYLYGTEDVELEVVAKLKNNRVTKAITTLTLSPGWNEITLDVTTQLRCETNGNLEYLLLKLIDGNIVTLGIGEIIVVG